MLQNIFVWRPFPWAYVAVYLGLLVSALTIRPSPYRRLIFLPVLFLTWRLLHDGQTGYLTSTFWFAYLLVASDYILLTDVQRELRQIPDAVDTRSPGITIANIEKASVGIRLKWALQLFFNPRGVGWAHEPRFAFASRSPPDTPRIKFIVRQLAHICVYLLLFDLGNLHARWNPGFSLRLGMVAAGWRWRVVGTVMWGITSCVGMSLAHCSASIVCVGLCLSRPQDWPPLFGDLMDAASVRTFWARGWHQLFRRFLCSHAKLFAGSKWVRNIAPDGSVGSSWMQMCSAFALSGLMHHLGESVPMGFWRSRSLMFFSIQPAAIALETLFALSCRRVVVSSCAKKALGLVWVVAWFSITLPIMQDPLLQTGNMDSRVDVSLIMWLLRGTWILPPT
ncbi:membrane bound O-acyl transferase family-domain-containing protein [Mycena sanguinolenta]|nr:membrane bound O-acyl transferase family-domain-containing protein [Mycena sanguinolenta]